MKRRVRITERMARRNREAVDGPPYEAYPGTVNQEDRTFKKREQYDNWKEVVNHPYPDMRDEWKNDSRDDIGFGISEANPPMGKKAMIASVREAASKAVKLAVFLLGDKVSENVIEAQARDFMRLGSEGLDSSLSRFAKTSKIYAQDEDKDEDKDEEAKTAQDESDEDESDEEEDAKEASEALIDKEDNKPSAKKVSGELDIELTQDSDEVEEDAEADGVLASIYAAESEDEDAEDEAEEVEAKEKSCKASVAPVKRGAKSIGGQPKVASSNSGSLKDLTQLWDSAPDITEVFK